jgi:putative transposase
VNRLEKAGVQVSTAGRGLCHNNIFIERLWRSVKYEDVYAKRYASVLELETGLREYFRYYNEERPHQGLSYRTPKEVYEER